MEISTLIEHFPYIGLFTFLILGGIALPFPEDATLLLCGFLISHNIVKPVPAVIVVYIGLIFADFFLFSVGRKYGDKVVTHKRFQKIITPDRLVQLEDKFKRRGGFIILLGRHLIGLRAQLFLVAGIMKIAPLTFFIYDSISSVFTMAIFIGIGYAGGNSLQVIKKDISRIEHIAIFLIVILLGIYLVVRYVRSRNKSKI